MSGSGNVPLIQLKDPALMRMQSGIVDKLNFILSVPFLNGILLEAVVLSSGNNIINHKLGRTIRGYFVTNQNAAASIYNSSPATLNFEQQIQLNASAGVTVDLWVF